MSEPGTYSLAGKRVFVAGHRGMVGGALVRRLAREDVGELLTARREDLDLIDPAAVDAWFAEHRPDAVFMAAAKVGGILANSTFPADFLHINLMIAANTVHAAHETDVEKFLFLGSSCIYPRLAPQPMHEEALLTGPLEPTNEAYAVAKIAGIKLCQAYRAQHGRDLISAMPTNLYGPGDSYDARNSHVVPALIAKAHAAKVAGECGMEIWGTGAPLREFMHVDDCADALVFLMQNYSGAEHINVGTGEEISIAGLARAVMDVVGLDGELTHDRSKPDGTPRKLMDNGRLAAMGWRSEWSLEAGLADAYRDYRERLSDS